MPRFFHAVYREDQTEQEQTMSYAALTLEMFGESIKWKGM